MNTNELLLFGAALVIFQLIALYLVIIFATKPDRRDRYQSQQIDLLILIAKKHGVTDEEIVHVLNR